jgi:putative DNA primase/helicase
MVRRSGQVSAFTARSLRDEGSLLSLAPLSHWEEQYPAKGGFDKSAAVNTLVQACYRAGVFSPDIIRGRGAWWDAGRSVLHVGTHLIVDGKRMEIPAFDSVFVYETAASFGLVPAAPLGLSQCYAFKDICDSLPWERSYMGNVLAGWCVCALVCGALAWRPHLWVIGAKGSGKSYLESQIIARTLGGIALYVSSKTTEPGIRNALGCDGRPVVFEEAEGQETLDRVRLQQVLDLARQASSEQGPAIIKGTRSGPASFETYRIRSCFYMTSIIASIKASADESRFMVCELRKEKNPSPELSKEMADAFARLQNKARVVLTDDFSSRLLARVIANIRTLRANAETFAVAASIRYGSRRVGDQIGAILAGVALLEHSDALTQEQAFEAMTRYGWREGMITGGEIPDDEDMLVSCIRQQRIEVVGGNTPRTQLVVGDLIDIAAGYQNHATLTDDAAQDHLMRCGIKVERARGQIPSQAVVWISNTHWQIKSWLQRTPWEIGWARSLMRLEGAKSSAPLNVYFSGSGSTKAVGVPFLSLGAQPF